MRGWIQSTKSHLPASSSAESSDYQDGQSLQSDVETGRIETVQFGQSLQSQRRRRRRWRRRCRQCRREHDFSRRLGRRRAARKVRHAQNPDDQSELCPAKSVQEEGDVENWRQSHRLQRRSDQDSMPSQTLRQVRTSSSISHLDSMTSTSFEFPIYRISDGGGKNSNHSTDIRLKIPIDIQVED